MYMNIYISISFYKTIHVLQKFQNFLCKKKTKAMCENNPGVWNNMKEELDSTLQVKVCLKVMVPGGWVEVLKTKRVSMI